MPRNEPGSPRLFRLDDVEKRNIMNNLSKITAGSLAAVLAFSMAACGSSSASSDGAGESAGKAVTVNGKSAKATSLADFGTMEDLEKAAKEEGALNVIALPHDWSNYGEEIGRASCRERVSSPV